MVNFTHGGLGLVQAVGYCVGGKSGVMFLARKSLFLGGSQDMAVLNQRRGTVVIKAETPRIRKGRRLENSIDERGYSRTL